MFFYFKIYLDIFPHLYTFHNCLREVKLFPQNYPLEKKDTYLWEVFLIT